MYRMGEEEIQAVAEIMRSRAFHRSSEKGLAGAQTFENDFKKYAKCDEFFLTTSGKSALICALTAMGIGPGDEVIVPAYTYIATAIAVTAVGAIPVIADINDTLGIDPVDVERKISKYTKAIIPVHMQGMPCDMDALMALGKKYNIYVLEDSCQGIGGDYKGKKLGTIGDAGAYSFNSAKNITAGEGGGLATNNRKIYEAAFIQHDSSGAKFLGDELNGFEQLAFAGNEYRVSNITGAILVEQLKRLDGIIADLRKNKKRVMAELSDLPIRFAPSNDPEGDCGNMLSMRFDDIALAEEFAKEIGPYSGTLKTMGRHIFNNWEPIMEKRGAFNDKMNPYLMEANKDLNMDYSEGLCQKTLDILYSTVAVFIYPDWTEEELMNVVNDIRRAAEKFLK